MRLVSHADGLPSTGGDFLSLFPSEATDLVASFSEMNQSDDADLYDG